LEELRTIFCDDDISTKLPTRSRKETFI